MKMRGFIALIFAFLFVAPAVAATYPPLVYNQTTGSWQSLPSGNGLVQPLPIQTITGASHVFVSGDLFGKTRRSNSGSAMTDTLMASTATFMANGAQVHITNVDASANDTITAGAGTTIGGNATYVLPPGRDISLSYDGVSAWRFIDNTSVGIIGPASSTAGHLATYADTTGKLLADGGAASTTINGIPCPVPGSCTIAGTLPSLYVVGAGLYGFACDDVAGTGTDDTAAFNALLTTVYNAGGGHIYVTAGCKLSSAQIAFPNSGGSPAKQPTIWISGVGYNASGALIAPSTPKAFLDLQFNAPNGKLTSIGNGAVIIDDIALVDYGTDCAPFLYFNNTVFKVRRVLFQGTHQGLAACNEIAVLGGTSSTIGFLINSPFQGYASSITDSYFDSMSEIDLQTYANSVVIRDNTWDIDSGNSATTAIASATNANPAVLTITAGHHFAVGQTARVDIIGATGSWTGINGTQTATVLSSTTMSIPVNSTGFGALAGSPAYYSGCGVNVGAGGTEAEGTVVSGNLFEATYYACFANLTTAAFNTNFSDNSIWDQGSAFTAGYIIANNTAGSEGLISDGEGPKCQYTSTGCGSSMQTVGAGASLWHPINSVINDGNWNNQTVTLGSLYVNQNTATHTPLSNTGNLTVMTGAAQSQNPLSFVDSTNTAKAWVGTDFSGHFNSVYVTGGNVVQFSAGPIYLFSSTAQAFFEPGNVAEMDYSASNSSAWTSYTPFYAKAFLSTGSAPTLTGTCTAGTQTGANTAGTFVATCTAQTMILTFATAAPVGWVCAAHDISTPADALNQTASTRTSCTLTGTTAGADNIAFTATGY